MSVGALLLFPGSGGTRDQAALVAIEQAITAVPVRRTDFPYQREARRRPPDRAPKLIASVRDEAAALAESTGVAAERIVLGGRSLGGRMCSMAVAEGLPAAGLVLVSYPLHPPGRPDKLRVEHLSRITVPCLFVSGTRDPFGTPEEIEHHTAAVAGPVTHVWIDGGRHELTGADAQVAAVVDDWVAGL